MKKRKTRFLTPGQERYLEFTSEEYLNLLREQLGGGLIARPGN